MLAKKKGSFVTFLHFGAQNCTKHRAAHGFIYFQYGNAPYIKINKESLWDCCVVPDGH